MKRVFAFALGLGWAFAGFRNAPRVAHASAAAFGVAVAVSVLVAYWAGTHRRRDQAVAAAVARAEASALAAVQAQTTSQASSTVNVIVPNPAMGAARQGAAAFGLEDAPWLAGRHRTVELDEREVVDTMLADVLDEHVDGVEA